MAQKAVLAGINNFKNINGLKGCVNDVLNVRDILKSFFGFVNNDIHVLTDTRATKNAIMDRLHDAALEAKDGDLLIFHFSGHGSQIADRNGDEIKDHLDELICPYDFSWEDETFILDDDIAEIVKSFQSRGARFEVILDACHSGTGLRDIDPMCAQAFTKESYRVSRYTPPPIDILCRFEDTDKSKRKIGKGRKLNSKAEDMLCGVDPILWSGCKSTQTSADAFLDNKYNGALTHAFCKSIRQGLRKRSDLINVVRQTLKKGNFQQTPQLECTEEQMNGNIFG